LQGLVGDVYANYPSYKASVIQYGLQPYGIETINCSFQKSNSLGYSLSGGFENRFIPALGFVFTISYATTIMKYPSITSSYSGISQYSYTQTTPATMSYGCLNVTLGLVMFL